MAHRTHKLQFEIVAVLGLIALFTHMHIFWIAGLLLAMIDLPDFATPLNRIAGSAEKLAGIQPGEDGVIQPPDETAESKSASGDGQPTSSIAGAAQNGDGAPLKPEIVPTKGKELIHA
jgi:hypothetical protein